MKISKLVLSFILSISLFSGVLSAQMASTDALVGNYASASSKDKLAQIISREDVVKRFEELGVDSKMIEARVASMTDEEASKIAYQIDTLPAGADGGASIIGAIVFIFIVLLITDILGVTKVFNFTKPITNN
ncbi:PA2779 family protein [Candidatus Sulfurimonas baltica]|uniref:PA2779 family protein n=1 Tax=Candidatus Sulfurimonas baltica TaxID=2740404 RepID=A0A7S7LT44_9BACT|nr:PA2779 family protein [Candidatus Sulfurimonas baltica]QOY51047.1 PA2779 family protein [Candidatus Sulfurimonas baltica]